MAVGFWPAAFLFHRKILRNFYETKRSACGLCYRNLKKKYIAVKKRNHRDFRRLVIVTKIRYNK